MHQVYWTTLITFQLNHLPALVSTHQNVEQIFPFLREDTIVCVTWVWELDNYLCTVHHVTPPVERSCVLIHKVHGDTRDKV